MRLRIIIVSFLSLLFTINGSAQTWDLKKDKKGVKVYVGAKKGSKYKQSKSTVEVNTTIAKMCDYLTNPDNYITHSSRIAKLKTLKKEKGSALYYLAIDLPIVSDRDGVYFVKEQSRTATEAKVTIVSKPTAIKEIKGYVRVVKSSTVYEIKKTSEGISLTMYMHAEPGGSVPAWIANYGTVDSPFEVLTAIKADLEKK